MDRRSFMSGMGMAAVAPFAALESSIPARDRDVASGSAADVRALAAERWHGTYTGTAEVHTGDVRYAGERVAGYTSRGAYTLPATVIVDAPLATGVNVEENPVHFQAGSDVSATVGPVAGDFVVLSAYSYSTPDHPQPSVIQAWRLQVRGNELTGTLTDNADVVFNFVADERPTPDYIEVDLGAVPFTLPYGTSLRATLVPGGLSLEILPPAIGTTIDPADQVAVAMQAVVELSRN